VLAKSDGQWHDVRQHSPWKILMRICAAILAFFAVMLTGCGGSSTAVSNPLAPAITTQPAAQSVMAGQMASFSVVAGGTAPLSYQWQKGTAAIAGATSASYTTPPTTLADSLSKFQVVVSNSAGSATSNQAVLTVNPVGGTTDVLTYHNDNARTGQNLSETVLTPTNVNSTTFGKLAAYTLDGRVDAQPLYASNVTVPGQGAHNLLVVPTEHDSVYALDADSGTVIWKTSMLKAGEQSSDDRGCGQVSPEIGVTDTPVIDRAHAPNGVVYAVAMSKDGSGQYHQRLHALDLVLGTELMGGPTEIQATFPGTGDGTNGTDVVFAPGQYKERVGLLLLDGSVYLGWASHCDIRPYTGWIMAYNANTLAQTSVLNVVPNGSEGAIWMAGAGLAADTSGNIYFLDANGDFDSNLTNGFPTNGNFGNAFLKLSTTSGLKVADYFEMDNQLQENSTDQDLGSGGAMLLPDLSDGAGHTMHLAVGAGKDTNIYIVNRDLMGKFSPSSNAIYQELAGALPSGVWSMPAYFNNTVYYGGNGDFIKAFSITNAKLSTTPTAQSSNGFVYPGATPSISANGASNGIVWALENTSTAVLHAYDATTLHELYNSNQATGGRDHFGAGNKFMTPTIVNGKVFVATPTGVAVFGILP
jgi:hypothetical protein